MTRPKTWQVEAEFIVGTATPDVLRTSDFLSMDEQFAAHLQGASDVQAGMVVTPTGIMHLMLTARIVNLLPGRAVDEVVASIGELGEELERRFGGFVGTPVEIRVYLVPNPA